MLTRALWVILVGSALVGSAPVFAAELGKLIVESSQAMPLSAEIEIDMAPGDPEPPVASLAPADAYRSIGLFFNPVLNDVRAVVQRRKEDNRWVLRLWSGVRIDQTYLEIIAWLGTPPAQVSKVYTVLLEPSSVARVPPPPPLVTPPAPQAEVRMEKVPEAPAPAPAPPARMAAAPPPQPVAPAAAPAETAAPKGTVEVKSGDTLAGIALANLPEGVTLNQMLVAIYRENENAFIDRNMNRVRLGATLTLPTADSAKALSDEEAKQAVRAQTEEYESFRRRAAAPAAAPTPAAPAEDKLRVAAQDERTARADDIAAMDLEITETKQRVARLEKHLADLQVLVELKSELLARLEAQARSQVTARQAGEAAASLSSQIKGTPAEEEFRKTHPCPATRSRGEACSGFVVTHVVPLCAGGANAPENMQWLPIEEAIEKERAAQERCRRG